MLEIKGWEQNNLSIDAIKMYLELKGMFGSLFSVVDLERMKTTFLGLIKSVHKAKRRTSTLGLVV